MITATFVKDVSENFSGTAKLWRLSEEVPIGHLWDDEEDTREKTSYIVTSATYVQFSGNETYIFAADEDGNVVDWGEMEGSYKGRLNHEVALEYAGYEIAQ